MELTNKQALDAFDGLTAIEKIKVPKPLAWKIHTSKKQLTPFIQTASDLLGKNQLEFAIKDDKGNLIPNTLDGKPVPNTFSVSSENIVGYLTGKSEIEAQTFTVDNVGFKFEEIPDTVEIEPSVLGQLEAIYLK